MKIPRQTNNIRRRDCQRIELKMYSDYKSGQILNPYKNHPLTGVRTYIRRIIILERKFYNWKISPVTECLPSMYKRLWFNPQAPRGRKINFKILVVINRFIADFLIILILEGLCGFVSLYIQFVIWEIFLFKISFVLCFLKCLHEPCRSLFFFHYLQKIYTHTCVCIHIDGYIHIYVIYIIYLRRTRSIKGRADFK